MVRLLFKNSNPKLRSTFWGSLFIPVGTNQTECCFSRFLLASRLTLYRFAPFLDSNHIWMWKFCVNLVNRLPICFWHPNRIFLSSYSGWFVWQLCCHSIINSNDTLSTMLWGALELMIIWYYLLLITQNALMVKQKRLLSKQGWRLPHQWYKLDLLITSLQDF